MDDLARIPPRLGGHDHLAGFTGLEPIYPRFISINQIGDQVEVHVRGAPGGGLRCGDLATVQIPPDIARDVFAAALERLDPAKSKATRAHVRPWLGAIVLYRDRDYPHDGEIECAAIVTRVWSDTVANLMVLPSGGPPFPMERVYWQDPVGQPSESLGRTVALDHRRTWRWPPRA